MTTAVRHGEGTLPSGQYWQGWTVPDPVGVVVFVHGVHEHGGRYAHVAERLAAGGYASYAPDHPGHGRSPGRRADIGSLAAAVEGVAQTVRAAGDRHPGVPVFVYGHSWKWLNEGPESGHELFGIKLTNKQRGGEKPTFFLMASIHARELSTSELALRFVDHLLAGYGVDADATWLLDEHTVVVVPVANPDGRRLAEQGLMQRKNMNNTRGDCLQPPDAFNQFGIDLNRNHDFKWGTVDLPTVDHC